MSRSEPRGDVASSGGLVRAVKDPRLLTEAVGEELVVFDRASNKAHLLAARAAAVLRASEKGVRLSELAPLMGDTDAARSGAFARLAVEELARIGLVVTSEGPDRVFSRRAILRTLGAAGAAPLVVSLLAPSPAAAATGLVAGDTCASSIDCSGCVGCICLEVGAEPSNKKCCNTGELGIGAVCVNTNECCCPDLECKVTGDMGAKTCVVANPARTCMV